MNRSQLRTIGLMQLSTAVFSFAKNLRHPICQPEEYLDLFDALKQRSFPKLSRKAACRELANRMLTPIVNGDTKGLEIPTAHAINFLHFLGVDEEEWPALASVNMHGVTKRGDLVKYLFYVKIDREGKGGIYLYHDPDDPGIKRAGKENLLTIKPIP